ncbi:MAG: sodium:solute symporter [Bacteroidetes bacterium]|nr:sodium:solute symporter [Bacteroidota bacterium]MBU1117245.1 sodium:solute symporter [Bacteroidota bacterium]MBU1799622.1 sodium:solute symporter [Bacteroidota bacterium]
MDRIIDYLIIVAYLIGVAIFGMVKGGKQKSSKDYFQSSDSVQWWAVCFSIVAAETSTLTFISIPGLAYLTNLNFIQVTIGYLLGRIVIASLFLPSYFKGDLSTAYEFLENRFGGKTRSFASIVFIFTRLAADGVRLFATAIPLKLMLDISYPVAIIIIAIIALSYTYAGGVKGVIWVDVIQMVIYLGGATVALGYLVFEFLPDGFGSIIAASQADGKLQIFNWGFDNGFAGFFSQPYTVLAGVLGGAFLSMASHGTDQLIVQRLLTTKSLKAGRKAIIGSGILVIIQFALFLFVGLGLYAFYGTYNLADIGVGKSDEIFPLFIIQQLPVGITGIIIAGLFAAALSTLAGSISALSSSTMLDLYKPFTGINDDVKELKISRYFTIMWAVLLVGSAFFFMSSPQTVVELALSIASFTYGGLLGTFLLGLLNKKATQEDALAGFTAGIFVMITVIALNIVAWTWFTLIGVIVTISIGSLLSKLSKSK